MKVNFSIAIPTYHLILLVMMILQLVHGQDVNVSQGLRGTNRKASLVEENLQTDLNGLETRHTIARKMTRRKKKVHEQTAKLEKKRIWWLNHKRN
jgi:hypothetical protein